MQHYHKERKRKEASDTFMQSQRKIGLHTNTVYLHGFARVDGAEAPKRCRDLPRRRRNDHCILIFHLLGTLTWNIQ